MTKQMEIEQMIDLINRGFNFNLISCELEISMDKLKEYEKQLNIRKDIKELIKNGNIQEAIQRLNDFIQISENTLVERYMLAKLNAYISKENISEEELQLLNNEIKEAGLATSIDSILKNLDIQIPRRKNSNIRKKQNQKGISEISQNEETQNQIEKEDSVEKIDYDKLIKKYEKEIEQGSGNTVNKRNLLAFAYFRAGRIDEARNELYNLIENCSSYNAYRQLIHIEKNEGNFEDAKLWAYDGLDKFPDSVDLRQYLISIARKEGNVQDEMSLLKDVIQMNPKDEKSQKRLKNLKCDR